MGIEQFFNNLLKIDIFKNNSIYLNLNNKIKCNYVYIDFNSIIYNVVTQIEEDLNYLLYELILHVYDSQVVNQKAHSIAKKWNYAIVNDKSILLEDYHKLMLTVNEDIIIENIKKYLKNLITTYFEISHLIKIYIAIDGIPTMSKIIEQKKRRYNGYILSGLKHKIFDNEYNNLSDKRKIYEKYKYGYDRNNLIAGSTLMQKIYINLLNLDLSVKDYIVSGPEENGEGEKKIMEDVVLNKNKGTYCIYSPDADVIILSIILHSLLLENKIDNTFKILRYDQITLTFNLIDINIFLDNIIKYIQSKTTVNLDKIRLYLDISYIYTFFGNDFIPRIEAIDIKRDLILLIDIYIDALIINNDPYIIKYSINDNKYIINYSKLIYLIN